MHLPSLGLKQQIIADNNTKLAISISSTEHRISYVPPIEHDGYNCNCDSELKAKKSPHVCICEPCLYFDFHTEGQTHAEYYKRYK